MQNPVWFNQVIEKYKAGASKFFILNGNVDDYVPGTFDPPALFLASQLDRALYKSQVSKQGSKPRYTIAMYGNGSGFTFPFDMQSKEVEDFYRSVVGGNDTVEKLEEVGYTSNQIKKFTLLLTSRNHLEEKDGKYIPLDTPRISHSSEFKAAALTPGNVGRNDLPTAVEPAIKAMSTALGQSEVRTILIVENIELIFPDTDIRVAPEGFRAMLGTIKNWIQLLTNSNHLVVFTTRDLSLVSSWVTGIGATTLEVDAPGMNERAEYLEMALQEHQVRGEWQLEEGEVEEKIATFSLSVAKRTASLRLYDLEDIILLAQQREDGITLDLVAQMKREKLLGRTSGALEIVEPKHGLNAVDGHTKIKQAFEQFIVRPLQGKGSMQDVPNGILFAGPPGTGKTYTAQALAKSAGMNFVKLNIGALYDKYVGETERRTREVIRIIEANAPITVFVDEVDTKLSRAGGGDSGVTSRIFSSLLETMSGNTGVIWIAATNNVERIDPALKRRFDKVAPFVVQVGEEQVAAVRNCMRRNSYPEIGNTVDLAELFAGYTGDDVQNVVKKGLQLMRFNPEMKATEALLEATKRIRRATSGIAEYTRNAVAAVSDTDWMPDNYWMPQEGSNTSTVVGNRLGTSSQWDDLDL